MIQLGVKGTQGVYQDHRILLIEQIPTQPFALDCHPASSRKAIKRLQAIWRMQTQNALEPSDWCPSKGWQLAEESDEGEK